MNDSLIAQAYGEMLGKVAAEALRFGLRHGAPPRIDVTAFPEPLRAPRATFVTLEEGGQLRGCVGSVAPRQALVEDIAANAFGAGFRDPRFRPLTAETVGHLGVGISILGPFETLTCRSEDELLAEARPGVDGFVLSADGRRGLFLPQVWAALPDPRSFFDALREKAGLPARFWSPQLHIERFQVTSIPKRGVATLISD